MATFVEIGQHTINLDSVSRFYTDQTPRRVSELVDEVAMVPRVSVYFFLQTVDQCLVLTGSEAVGFLAAFQPAKSTEANGKSPRAIR